MRYVHLLRLLPGLLATSVSNKSQSVLLLQLLLLLLLGDTAMAALAWFLLGLFFE
jgi:hypothetical protein